MGWRFRRSIKILPGIRLNFGKNGISSTTIGGKFFKTNVSGRGVRHTLSAPGTGLSYSTPTSKGSSETFDAPIPLNWYCENCYTGNRPDSAFCQNCGHQYIPPPIVSDDTRNSLLLIGGAVGFAVLLTIAGAIFITSRSTSTSISPPAQFASIPAPLVSPSATPRSIAQPNGTPGNYTKVVSKYTSLRAAPTISSSAVEMVVLGTTLELLGREGDWYFVKHDKKKGWIKIGDVDRTANSYSPSAGPAANYQPPAYSSSVPSYSSPSSSYSPPRPPDSESKSVHVRGYTRKDGTYVAPYTRRAPRR